MNIKYNLDLRINTQGKCEAMPGDFYERSCLFGDKTKINEKCVFFVVGERQYRCYKTYLDKNQITAIRDFIARKVLELSTD